MRFGRGPNIARRLSARKARVPPAAATRQSTFAGTGSLPSPAMRGKATIQLRQDTVTYGKKAARKAAAATALGSSEDDQDLFRALRVRRSALAKAEAVPAYVVLPDKSLIDMTRRRPATLAEMAEVHGIGEAKLKRYAAEFLAVIRQHQEGE